jgi:hypothetical protein
MARDAGLCLAVTGISGIINIQFYYNYSFLFHYIIQKEELRKYFLNKKFN